MRWKTRERRTKEMAMMPPCRSLARCVSVLLILHAYSVCLARVVLPRIKQRAQSSSGGSGCDSPAVPRNVSYFQSSKAAKDAMSNAVNVSVASRLRRLTTR